MKHIALTLSLIALTGSTIAPSVSAQESQAECLSSIVFEDVANGEFTKKRYSVHGTWSVSRSCLSQTLTFSDDFKTKSGPDLKVFLSPQPLGELDGKNAQDGALKLGVLKSNKGSQRYVIPSNIDMTKYKSVVIQCEAFDVLWGGFDLPTFEYTTK